MMTSSGNMAVSGGVAVNPTVLRTNLIFEFDAGNAISYPGYGTTGYDLSGNMINLSLVNGPTYSANTGYISCDGVNDYLNGPTGTSLTFGATDFTVEYWVRKNATTSGLDNIWGVNRFVGANIPLQCEWALGIGYGANSTPPAGYADTWQFTIAENANIHATGFDLDSALTIGQWHQIAGVRNGAFLRNYKDGVLIRSVVPAGMTAGTIMNYVAARRLRVANSGANAYYTKSDSAIIRIYNRALTTQELKTNFEANRGRFGI